MSNYRDKEKPGLSKLKTICTSLILFSFLLNTTNAQIPTIEWQNTIGGDQDDLLHSVKQTSDGGYILGGHSKSGISGDKTEDVIGMFDFDYWVVKLDGLGNIVWQNTIGGNSVDELYSVQQTSDGGYILGGLSYSDLSGDKTESYLGVSDYWVVKLDGLGNIVWQNTIGGNQNDELHSVQQTSDGGYILGGFSDSGISGDKTEARMGPVGFQNYWVVKLDGSGTIVWQNTIGGNHHDRLYSVQQTSDGGYILGGSSCSDISGDKTENDMHEGDYWVVKLDGSGNVVWENTIGGWAGAWFGDELYSVQQTSDGGYILGGYSYSDLSGDKTEANLGENDYWVVKLTPDPSISVEDQPISVIPDQLTVFPAFPNPFNPSTTIRYGIENDSRVTIEIYNISGKQILTLLNNTQTQGWYSVIWNGTNQRGELSPAGIYLSRITSDNEVKTTKLMLLK